jgi:hypothetical protein
LGIGKISRGLVGCAALNDVILGAVELTPDDAGGAVLLEVEPVRMGAVELVSDDVIGTELLEVELVRVDDDP